jgi:branched-chain amino acid transport system substrate-binding protein
MAACSLAALLPMGCTRGSALRLGYVAELSEAAADAARTSRNGALLAVEDWRNSPALQGRPVELLVRDLGATAADAQRAVDELVGEGASALIGAITSAGTLRLVAAAAPHGLIVVSPTATSMELHGRDDLLFRINGTTRDNGEAYARRCVQVHGWKRVAMAVTLQNRVFSGSWASEFEAALRREGGTVVRSVDFDVATGSSEAAVRSLLEGPAVQALVLVGNALDVAKLMQWLRRVDSQLPVMAAEWAASEQLIELGGRAVEGVEASQQYDRYDTSPRYTAFRDTYQQRFKEPPGYASVAGYDAAMVLLAAITGSKGSMAIKDALRKLGPFQGLQQEIAFDVNGDTTRRAHFMTVRDGTFARVR